MSLTSIGRLMLFGLLASLTVWAGGAYGPALASYLAEARNSTFTEARISARSLVYRVPESGALSFAFSQPVTQVKILVQPAVGETDRSRAAGFLYGLRIRLFGGDGAEIAVHDAYLQAAAPDEVFASGEVWRFFRNRPELVGEQDQLVVESPAPAARVEIEAIARDRAMLGIDLRLYEQRPFLSAQPVATFRRLSEYEQRKLAAANAFPTDMLTRQEMGHLARNHWRPVGPQGIEGRDYEAFVLYESSRRTERKGQP